MNALVAADGVVLTVQSEYYALEGLSHLIDTIKRIKAHWNRSLEIFGVVLTMYDRRLKLSREVEEEATSISEVFFLPRGSPGMSA